MPIDDLTALGQKMREARKKKDLTQQELADLSHVSVKQIAKSEGSEDMKQILIVEDDSFLNKMLAYNLTADGYGVTSALNARTAADAICQLEFDLVLL